MSTAASPLVPAVGTCVFLALAAAACGLSTPPSPAAPTVPGRTASTVPASPDALLAHVRAHEDAVSTLRARFTAELEHDDGRRRELDGVLVVRKPDAFRMSLISPLGLSVFDHVASGGRASTRYPMGAPGAHVPPPLSHEQMAQAFLRGEHAFPGRCEARETRTQAVEFRCAGPTPDRYRTITVDRSSAHILVEQSFADDREQLRITRSDYRAAAGAAGGVELPWHITLTTPGTDRTVAISVRDYEVDPPLADRLFAIDAR